MAWTTPSKVLDLTGETVTEANCAVASAMIDTIAGTREDVEADYYSPNDRRVLERAAGWQAPWVRDHPGLLTERENATDVSADSTRVSRESRMDAMLAPMAYRELENLSWVRTHTVHTQAGAGRAIPNAMDFLNERSDPLWLGS